MLKPLKANEKLLISKVTKSISNGDYVILPHARKRCSERNVSAADIEHVLEQGKRIKARDRYDEPLQRWSYAYEGKTIDDERLRVIISFLQTLVIVTVVKIGDVYE